MPIDPELVRRRVVGDVEVQPSIVVVVGGDHTKPGAIGATDARGVGDIGEVAVPVVSVQTIWYRPVIARTTVVRSTRRVRALLVSCHCEVQIIRDEEVEISVAVVLEERGPRAPQGIADAGLPCHVAKRAVPVVSEERLRSKTGDE